MKAPDWTVIDDAARALGVTETALEQWHTRGWVPHKWRLPIIRHAGLPLDFRFGEAKASAA